MKDLGHLRYFLGLGDCSSRAGLSYFTAEIHIWYYWRCCTYRYKYRKYSTRASFEAPLSDGTPLADPLRYRQLVGIIYLCLTRSDIVHAVSIVCQFVSAPHSARYSALQILKYLRGIITRSLFMSSISSLKLWAYFNVDWAGCPYTRRSTTGFYLFLGESLISWRSKKQDVVSCFSCEAEFRAMATTTREIVYVRRLLADFGVFLIHLTPFLVIIKVL